MDKRKLKELFSKENGSFRTNIAVAFMIGVLLIFLGNTFFSSKLSSESKSAMPSVSHEDNTVPKESGSKEKDLEKRLESILSKVEGAGEVEVMVSLSYGKEKIVAEETKTESTDTTENASQGDKRDIKSTNSENKVVLTENADGSTSPLILKELEPQVEGVIIVAQGGDSILVKDSLSKAVQALLNVPAHKVEILKMK